MTDNTKKKKERFISEPLPKAQEPVRFRLLVRICALIAGAIGLTALVGWAGGFPFLANFGPGKIPMAPSTAVLFTLYGVTVFFRSRPMRQGTYWTVLSIHAAAALIALLLAILSYHGVHPQAEHFGISILDIPGTPPVGHMSPVTAFGFLLASLSFLASLPASPAGTRWATAAGLLACLLLLISYLLVLAYLFGTPLLYGGSVIPPALPTSLAFMAIGTALLTLARQHARQSLDQAEPDVSAPYWLIVVFIILAMSILAIGYLSFRGYEKHNRTGVERQLTAIAELKVAELVQWRSERMADGQLIYKNAVFSKLTRRYFRNPQDGESERQLREWISLYPKQHDYDQVRLLDPQGVTRLSFPTGQMPASAVVSQRIAEVLQSGRITMVDFYRHEPDQRIYLSLLIPIIDVSAANRVIGIVSLRIDPEKYLYPFILRWPTPSDTAETLLVRRDGADVLYLINDRFIQDSALRLRIPLERTDVPSVMAVLGRTGIAEGVDYRDEPVIADVRSVPESPWFLVARMNTSEALAQARGQLWITIGFVTALLFGAGATLINVWRRQSIAFYQERNRAAASLRESERFLRETQWVAGLGTYDLDLQTGRWKSSEILDNIFGIDETFVRSVEGWATLIHPDDREMMMDYFTKEVLGNHQRFDKEYRIIRKNDGAERWVHGLGRLQLNAEGQPIMMIGTIQGITARKQMDEELKSSEALYHDLVATSQDLIWQCDAEENYIYLNPAWETVFGYKVEEMLGKKFTDFQRPTDVARDMKEFTRLLSGGTVKGFESTHIGKDGQDIHLVFNAKVVTDKHGKVIGTSGTAYDITERIKAEEALRASESFIKKILETVGEGIVVIDQSYKILSANKAYLDLTNTHPETVLGKCCYGISHHLSKPCDEAGEDCPLRRTLDTGESHDAIHTHYDEKGAKRIVEIRTYPMKDESGKVISAIEVINDITDKHKLEDQLRQAQKMESIGTLAGGIAHDFNNILTAIVGYGHIVLMKMAKDDPLRVNIEHMLEAGDRAAHLTKSLLLFSRKQISERKPVDLNEIIRTVENFLKRVIGEDVECTAALFEEALPILGDAHQLEQVLMNLATNARDAMSTGGIFAITTEQVRFDEEFITIHGYGKPGIYGSITLSDTGTGMDAVTREHIFEPFFTTKDAEKGTGLGLAIVYGIIKQHEGFINVYSEPGQGTSFKIYLPLIALGADEEKKITEERPVGGAETILLAEDDETVRNMTKAVLEDVGYHVITANDGQDAVNKYKENKDMVRLLLFDLIMPKRTGKEAYDEIKAMTPAVKVLFASGYAPDMVRHKVLLDDDMPVVYKPISPTELLKQVRASLDR